MVRIVTDSTCDLSPEVLDQHTIRAVPLNVHFGEENYKDGEDLLPDRFYEMLKTNPIHPKTSQPSPEEFKSVYQELLSGDTEIVSVHISSKMSGTHQSATIAKNELGNDKVHVVDSGYVSVALGLMAIRAAEEAAAGKTAAEIVALLEELKERMQIYFIVDTLEYLQKGGRIGKASAVIGGLLNIKPILTIKEGQVCPFEKVRGSAKVFARMAKVFGGHLTESRYQNVTLGLAHAANPDLLKKLTDQLDPLYDTSNALTVEIGPVVGTHAGPGTVGIFFY
jgi:DegV family protein with EDD domain